MSKPNDGGPAFSQTDCALPPNVPYSGMSLRAWLAGMAMGSILAGLNPGADYDWDKAAQIAVKHADTLLSELEKEDAK